jgi:hypothetical protein
MHGEWKSSLAAPGPSNNHSHAKSDSKASANIPPRGSGHVLRPRLASHPNTTRSRRAAQLSAACAPAPAANSQQHYDTGNCPTKATSSFHGPRLISINPNAAIHDSGTKHPNTHSRNSCCKPQCPSCFPSKVAHNCYAHMCEVTTSNVLIYAQTGAPLSSATAMHGTAHAATHLQHLPNRLRLYSYCLILGFVMGTVQCCPMLNLIVIIECCNATKSSNLKSNGVPFPTTANCITWFLLSNNCFRSPQENHRMSNRQHATADKPHHFDRPIVISDRPSAKSNKFDNYELSAVLKHHTPGRLSETNLPPMPKRAFNQQNNPLPNRKACQPKQHQHASTCCLQCGLVGSAQPAVLVGASNAFGAV